MNVVNTGRRGSRETIVLAKRRVPCGIETQYSGLRRKGEYKTLTKEKVIFKNRSGLSNHSIAVVTLI